MAKGCCWLVTALAVAGVATAVASPAARAVMSGAESRLAGSSDPEYAAGKAAFEREDWPGVVGDLTLVVVRRP